MKNTAMSKASFFGAAIGTVIEYYDYVLFMTFLPVLSPIFFPADTSYQSLVKGYFILVLTAIARPLGGLFFGYLGDTKGRKFALLCSMSGIAIATMMIGFTPTYQSIGEWATAMILLAKMTQTFCFGGEFNGGGLYVVEHASFKKEGLMGGLFSTSTLFGGVLASFTGVLLTASFMPSWSWRIGFIFGGLIGLLGMRFRSKMLEVPAFKSASLNQDLSTLFKKFPRELCAGVFIGGLVTIPYMTAFGFVMPVLTTNGTLTKHGFMWLQAFLNVMAVCTLLLVSRKIDTHTPVKIMRLACYLTTILVLPIFYVIDKGNLIFIIIALSILNILNELFFAPCNAYMKNLFNMQYRYRGISVSFCLGMSFLGSLTPIVESYLYQWTGYFSSIAIWIAVVTLGTVWAMKKVADRKVVDLFSGETAGQKSAVDFV